MQFKSKFSVILVAVVSLFFAGCFDIEYDIEITKDDIQTTTMKVGMNSFYIDQADDMISGMEEQGYKVTIKEDGDKSYIIGKMTSKKGEGFLPYPGALVNDKSGFDFKKETNNYFLYKEYIYTVNYKVDPALVDEFMEGVPEGLSIPITYNITMPGKISTTNSENVVDNTMTWKYRISKNMNVDMSATSTVLNYPGIIFSSLMVIFIILFVVFRRNKLFASVSIGAAGTVLVILLILIATSFSGSSQSKEPSKISSKGTTANKAPVKAHNKYPIEGTYSSMFLSEESGDNGGSIVIIKKDTKDTYTAQWGEFQGTPEPSMLEEILPVTVKKDTVSLFVYGTLWKGVVNDTAIIAMDGTVFSRE